MKNFFKSINLIFSISTLILLTATPVLSSTRWVNVRNGNVPSNAISGGTDNNQTLYICTVGFATGKLLPSMGKCLIGWGGKEHGHSNYKVLVGNNYQWVRFRGQVPRNAVIGGSENGLRVYVCSGVYDGEWTPGKYVKSIDSCLIGWGGKERAVNNFHILVNK